MVKRVHASSRFKRFGGKVLRSWWTWLIALVLVSGGLFAYQRFWLESTSGDVSRSASSKKTETDSITYGIALGGALTKANAYQRAQLLSQIKKAGFTQVRLTIGWPNVEAAQGEYTWSSTDAMMEAVKKSGLSMVILVDRAPGWARASACAGSETCAPKNAADYAAFVGKAAERYKSYNVDAWEVWNEENNNNFWKPYPDPKAYTELLIAANQSIMTADPDATVIVGGLSGDSVDKLGKKMQDPRTFLSSMYDAGAGGHFDGVGYHPYIAGGGLPTKGGDYNGWAKMNATSTSMRSIMQANGDAHKKLWLTEFGMPTGGTGPVISDPANPPKNADHVTYDAQTQIMQAVLDDLDKVEWVENLDWYTFKDSAAADKYTGASYGLLTFENQPKPAFKLLQSYMDN